jgi:hypothetical protein
MQVQEKDKAFASPLYTFGELNGSPDGFPATSIIWIHHDNASGEARGTRYLPAAVDEEWHLRPLTDEERRIEREAGRNPSNCRFVQIKKSRLGREGDRLLVERNVDFSYSVRDFTPTERRSDFGQGDPEPHTMALRIIRDAKRDAGEMPFKGLTAAEVADVLGEELLGQGRKGVSVKTTRRWLDRWVEDGILVRGKPALSGEKNRKTTRYTTPHTRRGEEPAVLRAMSVFRGDLSPDAGNLSEGLGLSRDNPEDVSLDPAPVVPRSTTSPEDVSQPVSRSGDSPEDSPPDVPRSSIATTGVSGDPGTTLAETDIRGLEGKPVSPSSQVYETGSPVTTSDDLDAAFGPE